MQALIDGRIGNNTWVHRKEITSACVICGSTFSAQTIWKKTCSPNCKKEYINIYSNKRRKDSIEGTLGSIVASCIYRAKKKNLPVDIDLMYVLRLLEKQQGLCAVTGIELMPSATNTKKESNPWTVSVDRIDSTKGYTKDNIRLVCLMYNICKGIWTDADVRLMCEGVLT